MSYLVSFKLCGWERKAYIVVKAENAVQALSKAVDGLSVDYVSIEEITIAQNNLIMNK